MTNILPIQLLFYYIALIKNFLKSSIDCANYLVSCIIQKVIIYLQMNIAQTALGTSPPKISENDNYNFYQGPET